MNKSAKISHAIFKSWPKRVKRIIFRKPIIGNTVIEMRDSKGKWKPLKNGYVRFDKGDTAWDGKFNAPVTGVYRIRGGIK